MDVATLEEANRLRISLGMKPLPVPGAVTAEYSEATSDREDEEADTLESRQAKAVENFKAHQEAGESKVRREKRAAAVRKARETAQRFTLLDGKGLADEDDDKDTKSWLRGQKKRQIKIEREIELQEELDAAEAVKAAARQHISEDLSGVQVAHDLTTVLDGDEQILTLKDSTIEQNEEEGDKLENIRLREREQLQERLDLKKKSGGYNPFDSMESGEQAVLAQYDEEIYGKKEKKFVLGDDGGTADFAKQTLNPEGPRPISLDIFDDIPAPSDYLGASEIMIKRPKKKSKSARRRVVDEDSLLPADLPVVETPSALDLGASVPKKRKIVDEDYVDDEDLQASLSIARQNALNRRKKTRPQDITRLSIETAEPEPKEEESDEGGLLIGEISEFVANIKKSDEPERMKGKKPSRPPPAANLAVTAMDLDVPDDGDPSEDLDDVEEHIPDGEGSKQLDGLTEAGVEQEKTFDRGIGSALGFLRERKLVESSHGAELNDDYRQQQKFLINKGRILDEMEELARQQRERDRNSGRLDRMSMREKEDYARQQNAHRDLLQSRKLDELFQAQFRPHIEIIHRDELGRECGPREAFKHLSHQFHGRGSGKGKTDKKLKQVANDKRREAASVIDTTQNVGMSTATAQQTKKRKEAGVRLG